MMPKTKNSICKNCGHCERLHNIKKKMGFESKRTCNKFVPQESKSSDVSRINREKELGSGLSEQPNGDTNVTGIRRLNQKGVPAQQDNQLNASDDTSNFFTGLTYEEVKNIKSGKSATKMMLNEMKQEDNPLTASEVYTRDQIKRQMLSGSPEALTQKRINEFDNEKFIPLSKHNEEIEKSKIEVERLNKGWDDTYRLKEAISKRCKEFEAKYDELLSRINSIQTKAEKGCKKNYVYALSQRYLCGSEQSIECSVYCKYCQVKIDICKRLSGEKR